MAINSPNVIQTPSKDLDLVGYGMQLGSQLGQAQLLQQQKKQADADNAKNVLDMMIKSAGGPDAIKMLLKDEKSRTAVSSLFQTGYGMDAQHADDLTNAMANQLFENPASAMNYAMQFQAQGPQMPSVKDYADMDNKVNATTGGEDTGTSTTTTPEEDVTTIFGQTYSYNPAKLAEGTSPTGQQTSTTTTTGTTTPTTTGEKTHIKGAGGGTPVTYTPGSGVTPQQRQGTKGPSGNGQVVGGTDLRTQEEKDKALYYEKRYGKPKQTQAGAVTDAAASVGVTIKTPTGTKTTTAPVVTNTTTTQTPEEKIAVQSGTWTVKDPKGTVGVVTNGRFQPNDDFMWTNEQEMWSGLAKQTWGDKGSDVEAFKQMAYNNAKKEGYKGTYEQFIQPKSGRKTENNSWMPQGYDWMRQHGLEITRPEQVAKDDPEIIVGDSKTIDKKTAGSMRDVLLKKTKQITKDFGDLYKDPNQFAAMISNFDKYGDIQKGRIKTKEDAKWYAAWTKYKENEGYTSKFLGAYANYLSKDPDTFRRVMEHEQRVYNAYGGDKILDTLVPNQTELERAKIDAQMRVAFAQMSLQDKLDTRNMDIQQYRAENEKLATDREYALRKALAEREADKAAYQNNSDFAKIVNDQERNALDMLKQSTDTNLPKDTRDALRKTATTQLVEARVRRDPTLLYIYGTDPKTGNPIVTGIRPIEDVVEWVGKMEPWEFDFAKGKFGGPGGSEGTPTYGVIDPNAEKKKKATKTYQEQQKTAEQEANNANAEMGIY